MGETNKAWVWLGRDCVLTTLDPAQVVARLDKWADQFIPLPQENDDIVLVNSALVTRVNTYNPYSFKESS